VLETTGLADPLPVAWTFNRPGLSEHYRLDAIVTVVDSKHVGRAVAETDEARLQIERADILLLNKLDLVEDDGAAAEILVRRFNGVAPVLRAVHGCVPWALLLPPEDPLRIRTLPHKPGHAAAYESFVWETDRVLSERTLEDVLYEVPTSIFRIKGLVRTSGSWPWALVNVVAGRIDVRPLSPREAPEKSALVFIGKELDRAALASLCARLLA
jgi:G3E family GTPase